jgi:predicted nucleic acid-binding protein
MNANTRTVPPTHADILVAAQAVTRGYTLVTNNVKHFEGIDGLVIENWVTEYETPTAGVS